MAKEKVLVVGGEVAAWAKGNLIHELELCLMAKVALLLTLTTITVAIRTNHFIEVASDRTEAEATTSMVRAKADRIPTSALMMVVARTEASLNLNSRATATNATTGATKKRTAMQRSQESEIKCSVLCLMIALHLRCSIQVSDLC